MNSGFNLVNKLTARQKGLPVVGPFQSVDKWQINKKYLPNTLTVRDYEEGTTRRNTFTSNGDVLVAVSSSHGISFYDTRYKRYKVTQVIRPSGMILEIGEVAISPDDTYVIFTSWSNNMHLNRINSDEPQSTFSLTSDINLQPNLLCFSKSSNTLFVGASDNNIYFFDLTRLSCIHRIEPHREFMTAIAIASDASQVIYSSNTGGLINVFDIRTEHPLVGVFTGHTNDVIHIDSKGDSRYLISTALDETVKLWDLRFHSAHHLRSDELFWGMQYLPNRGNMQGKVEDGCVMTYTGHTGRTYPCFAKFSPLHTTGQQFITIGCEKGRIFVYDLKTARIEAVLRGHDEAIRDVTWHPYRNEIVSCDWLQNLQSWTYMA